MFLKNSRYAETPVTEGKTSGGRAVTALKLRRLPATPGTPYVVSDKDQLDVMSQERFGDGTKYWHIADANTELEAEALLQTGATIQAPES